MSKTRSDIDLSKIFNKKLAVLISLLAILVAFQIGFYYGAIHEGFNNEFSEYTILETNETYRMSGKHAKLVEVNFTDSLEWERGNYTVEGTFGNYSHLLRNRYYVPDNRTFILINYETDWKPEINDLAVFGSSRVYVGNPKINGYVRLEDDPLISQKLNPHLPLGMNATAPTGRFKIGDKIYNLTPQKQDGFVFTREGYFVKPMERSEVNDKLFRIDQKIYFELGNVSDTKFKKEYFYKYAGQRFENQEWNCGDILPLLCT